MGVVRRKESFERREPDTLRRWPAPAVLVLIPVLALVILPDRVRPGTDSSFFAAAAVVVVGVVVVLSVFVVVVLWFMDNPAALVSYSPSSIGPELRAAHSIRFRCLGE